MLSNFSAMADGLPELPLPIKNVETQNNSSSSDIADYTEEKDLEVEDKKLELTDDFFKKIDTAIKQKNSTNSNVVDKSAEDNKTPSTSTDLPPLPVIKQTPTGDMNSPSKNSKASSSKEISLPNPYNSDQSESDNLTPKEEMVKDDYIPEIPKIPPLLDLNNSEKGDSNLKKLVISKFKEEINRKNAERFEEEMTIDDSTSVDKVPSHYLPSNSEVVVESQQQKFVSDETKVLILPNDDVVLGEITQNASLNLIDFSSYVKIFWRNYDENQRSKKREEIDNFIDNYNDNFNKVSLNPDIEELNTRLDEAFTMIDNQAVNKLIIMLNNYNISQMIDHNNNTLMHHAAYRGNYSIAKLLVMKGVDLNAKNMHNESPLYVAEKYNNKYVVYLLNQAGALSISE
jgi:hypothetical protein